MARITSYEDSKQFDAGSGLDIFSLSDDGDSDRVQFLMHGLDDVLIYTTHEVKMKSQQGKDYDRKVGCLKSSVSDGHGVCPLCDQGSKIKLARFIPLYSHSQKKVVLWERSGQFIEKNIASCINRMIAQGRDPRKTVVEVVRCGKKGDRATTYQFYPMENMEAVSVDDLEIPDPEGTLIATWSQPEMQNYVTTGQLPAKKDSDNDVVTRRADRSSYSSDNYTSPDTGIPDSFGAPVSDPTSLF